MAGAALVHVIDSDSGTAESIRATLQQAGFAVRTYPSIETFASAKVASDSLGGASADVLACVLLDAGASGGLEKLRPIAVCPVIVMMAAGSVRGAVEAIRRGAADVVEKPCAGDALVEIVHDTLEKYQMTLSQRRQRDAVRARLATLSPRETELLDAIVQGHSTKIIATTLGISARTVDHHRASLMDKMNAVNVADLVRMAMLADYRTVRKTGEE